MDLLDIFDEPPPSPPPTKKIVERAPEASASEAAPALPPDQEFLADLIYWLENVKTEPPRAPGLHASSLWKTCARVPLLQKMFADELEVERITAGSRMTFDVGHALHDLIQTDYCGPWGRLWGSWKCIRCQDVTHEGTMPAACPRCGLPSRDPHDNARNIVYAETPVHDKELQYVGHCDGIILDRAGNKRVFEFKTISKSQYEKLRAPKAAHVIQAHAYMSALGLREAIIVYWDKGSQCDWSKDESGRWVSGPPRLKVYLVAWDQALWNNMITRIKNYHRAAETARRLPVVSAKDVSAFSRVCSHSRCALAEDCSVSKFCFKVPG